MKRIYSLIAAALLLVVTTSAQAQESWSLQKCIDYALKKQHSDQTTGAELGVLQQPIGSSQKQPVTQPECRVSE